MTIVVNNFKTNLSRKALPRVGASCFTTIERRAGSYYAGRIGYSSEAHNLASARSTRAPATKLHTKSQGVAATAKNSKRESVIDQGVASPLTKMPFAGPSEVGCAGYRSPVVRYPISTQTPAPKEAYKTGYAIAGDSRQVLRPINLS